MADSRADRCARPGRPIPAGLLTAGTARRVALVAGTLGLGLAAVSGPVALVVAAAGLAAGLAYDVRLKGTAWSWVPYAVGIPLLPLFAWVGAGAGMPAPLLVLLHIAAIAGAELVIANALADLERDREAGVTTVATRLGRLRAGRLAGLHALVVAGGTWASLLELGAEGPGLVLAAGATASLATGVALGWSGGARAREVGWELQAVAIGALAVGWALALVDAGRL